MSIRGSGPALVLLGVALTGALAACSGSGSPAPLTSDASGTSATTASAAPSDSSTATSSPTATDSPTPAVGPTPTVWLCRPGTSADPCAVGLNATSVTASGSRTTVRASAAANPKADCFYVYPTVSTETGLNADLAVQRAEVDVAVEQAARFSQVCRVWAPMYRQVTVAGLSRLSEVLGGEQTAYASLLSAWKDYLAHDNDGRPIVFIGHSQGAAMLIDLLREQVDPNPALRARTVSALLLGGNVQVPTDGAVGGTFTHLPLCHTAGQTTCVIAYSSFDHAPPSTSLFGRPGTGVSLLTGQTSSAGQQVACVNPADLASPARPTALTPYFAARSSDGTSAVWSTYPREYTGACISRDEATWLQIDDVGGAHDPRPRVQDTLGPTWGLHVDDVNLALGDLVGDVRQQVAAYRH